MITGLSIPLKTMAITQYLGIPATGAAMLSGKVVVTAADGIHVIDSAASDNGTKINACIKTIRTDFGQHARKRVRTVFVRGKANTLQVTLTADDTSLALQYQHTRGFSQDGGFVQGRRTQSGVYWQFEVKNVSGGDFSIDAVDVLVNTLSLRR